MRQLEGPGSEGRLRRIQARFRAVRSRVGLRNGLRAALPTARELLILFAAFVIFGAVVVWLID